VGAYVMFLSGQQNKSSNRTCTGRHWAPS